ncbi:MAG: hypothetical protein HY554_16350 [Elusimicrobia bacterium]|nr:hypothetical protein [Elusimicrobiota bacterium]
MKTPIVVRIELSTRQLKGLLAMSVMLAGAYALHSEGLTLAGFYASPVGSFREVAVSGHARLAASSAVDSAHPERFSKVFVGPPGHETDAHLLQVNGSAKVNTTLLVAGSAQLRGLTQTDTIVLASTAPANPQLGQIWLQAP